MLTWLELPDLNRYVSGLHHSRADKNTVPNLALADAETLVDNLPCKHHLACRVELKHFASALGTAFASAAATARDNAKSDAVSSTYIGKIIRQGRVP